MFLSSLIGVLLILIYSLFSQNLLLKQKLEASIRMQEDLLRLKESDLDLSKRVENAKKNVGNEIKNSQAIVDSLFD